VADFDFLSARRKSAAGIKAGHRDNFAAQAANRAGRPPVVQVYLTLQRSFKPPPLCLAA